MIKGKLRKELTGQEKEGNLESCQPGRGERKDKKVKVKACNNEETEKAIDQESKEGNLGRH